MAKPVKTSRITCDADIDQGVRSLAKSCPTLRAILKQCGPIPLRLQQPGFAGLASIIVSQQVSRASAVAIFGRLEQLINPLTAENYLASGETAWIEAGLSRPKQRTFLALCAAIAENGLDLEQLCDLDAQIATQHLTDIKGIGPWTAEIYLMFCAGHPNIFPAGDLALQEAIKLAKNLDERPTEKQCRTIAQDWAPWRAVAARILWDYYRVVKHDALPV